MMEFVARKLCAWRFSLFFRRCTTLYFRLRAKPVRGGSRRHIYIQQEHSAESASSSLQIFYKAQKFDFMIPVSTTVMEVVQL